MIEVTVKNILFFAKADSPGYTLFLQSVENESKSLPIVVGQFEAQAIAMAMEQISLNRPMTHDLLSAVVNKLSGGLVSVSISALREGTFYAQLLVKEGERIELIDARPSDAIALALREEVPIRVASSVFRDASVDTPDFNDRETGQRETFSDNLQEITRKADIRFDLEKNLKEAVSRIGKYLGRKK